MRTRSFVSASVSAAMVKHDVIVAMAGAVAKLAGGTETLDQAVGTVHAVHPPVQVPTVAGSTAAVKTAAGSVA